MNYIDRIAAELGVLLDDCKPDLLRLYALLVLVTGVNTTEEAVHDAWIASAYRDQPEPSVAGAVRGAHAGGAGARHAVRRGDPGRGRRAVG
ncbi:hypothetical protein Drose_06405 [Dactylosporangium roseum]|uniref:DUF7701 domain-containing protein n=1 Tax=Dactylosporangium roseum TaxID=47989 RepID=A0ABY5ZC43_9ACTN|nr:hypothetical protein [Dactylosporangium roseum]UWZ37904.1 hypothetical protein Drose_06405 [Dactylosporangium roseum]